MTPAYIVHAGRILPVVALVKQNGIGHACIMPEPGKPELVPLSRAVQAPQRSKPRLVTVDGERV